MLCNTIIDNDQSLPYSTVPRSNEKSGSAYRMPYIRDREEKGDKSNRGRESE